MFSLGYRLGMLLSGGGALILSDHVGWHSTYMIMAAVMGLALLVTLTCREPDTHVPPAPEKPGFRAWLADAVITPFADFMKREQWWLILGFIALYKLGDAFLGAVTNPFLLEIGFTKTEIGSIVKFYGVIATIAGTFLGGWLTMRYGIIRLLYLGAFLHGSTNLMYLLQARAGADLGMLTATITLDNMSGGVSSAILVVFISRLCRMEFTATQYALLSSLAALGRTTLSSSSGWFVAR